MLLTILTMAVALFLSPTSSLPKRLARGGRQGRGGRAGHGGGHRLAPPPPPKFAGGRRGRQEVETGTLAPSELEISPDYQDLEDPRAAGASAPEVGYGAPGEEQFADASPIYGAPGKGKGNGGQASLGIYGAPGKGKGNGGQGNGGNGGAGDGEGDLPAWCDPTDPMGAWMNYVKIRQWCESNGFTEHGPYGGSGLDVGSGGGEDY